MKIGEKTVKRDRNREIWQVENMENIIQRGKNTLFIINSILNIKVISNFSDEIICP